MRTETGDEIAVVANQIVQARHRLNPRQQKVIAWAISKIARDDKEFREQRLEVAEFAHLTMQKPSGSIYKEMEQVTTSLLQEVLHVKANDGDRTRRKFQWLSKCDYCDKAGAVIIKLHDEMRPYLLELRARFTQLRLEKFFQLKSSYSIRFFERIEMLRGLKKNSWEMTIDELRDWLGIESELYEKFGLLRANVIDVPQRELDAKGDWSFSFTPTKTGRKITGIVFEIRPANRRASGNTPTPKQKQWQKLGTEIKAQVLNAARDTSAMDGLTDEQILENSLFWDNLDVFISRVVSGQNSLPLS